jgi:hypothetical protein|tara:strand:- start:654 stop:842 length:189 start_codon:yes stop_codon:yes gene_type:complete
MTVSKDDIIEQCDKDITQAKKDLVDRMAAGSFGNLIDKNLVYTELTKIIGYQQMKQYAEDNL